MNMIMKTKMTRVILLVLFSLCLHLHASSNPKQIIRSIGTLFLLFWKLTITLGTCNISSNSYFFVDTSEDVVHKTGVNLVIRRGGGGGGHGGGGGGHVGGGSHGVGGDLGVVIPVYARSHPTRRGHQSHAEHNLPQLVSTILAFFLLLTYCVPLF